MAIFLLSFNVHATFIPQDKIRYSTLKIGPSNMTKDMFDAALKKAKTVYGPIVKDLGATLVVNSKWKDETINASAQQFGTSWQINMYGGLARYPDLTPDGFMLVICHELGHHLGGFAFYQPFFGGVWAANEGQSDYFATQACAHKMWGDEKEENAKFRETAPEVVKMACDKSWGTTEQQDLCYRSGVAAKSLAATLASLSGTPEPMFDTPDKSTVGSTSDAHPEAQCRLDTTFQGALCTMPFDEKVIPGKDMADQFGPGAEREASIRSCSVYGGQTVGLRPTCWFKSQL